MDLLRGDMGELQWARLSAAEESIANIEQIKTEAEQLMKTQLCNSNQIAEETVPMPKYKQDRK